MHFNERYWAVGMYVCMRVGVCACRVLCMCGAESISFVQVGVGESELFCPGANGNHCLSHNSCLISVCCCGNAAVLESQDKNIV